MARDLVPDTPDEALAALESDPSTGRLVAATIAALDASSVVDADINARLDGMRRAAVARSTSSSKASRRWYWSGLGTAVAAAVVAVIVAVPRPAPDAMVPAYVAEVDELAVVAELELLEELEFVAWLDQTVDDPGLPAPSASVDVPSAG